MTTCNCKSEVNAKLIEFAKRKWPGDRDHSAGLKGYSFALLKDKMVEVPGMAYEVRANGETKAGKHKALKESGTMFFTFCPFCGVKLEALR